MRKHVKLAAIRDYLGTETALKGDEAIFFCPKHGHKAGRSGGQLSVNLFKDTFHCWSCGWGGSLPQHGEDSNKKGLLPLFKAGDARRRAYLEHIGELPSVPIEKVREYSKPSLPTHFKSLSRPTRSPFYAGAMAYLAQRGVSLEDILRYKLGYCEDGEYKNRIIIPSFDVHGELNFCVGRSFYDDPRKYKHDELDKDIIFNEYMIDWSQPVILTEGPFDAIKAGTNAIPLQGNGIKTESLLFNRILFEGQRVYFALDSDAVRQQLKAINKFQRHGVECWLVDLGRWKDPGEMTKEEFQSELKDARSVDDIEMMRIALDKGIMIGGICR